MRFGSWTFYGSSMIIANIQESYTKTKYKLKHSVMRLITLQHWTKGSSEVNHLKTVVSLVCWRKSFHLHLWNTINKGRFQPICYFKQTLRVVKNPDISVIKKSPAEGAILFRLLLCNASDCHCISCLWEKFVPIGLSVTEFELF